MRIWAPLAAAGVLAIAVWAAAGQDPARPAGQVLQSDEPTRIQVDVTRVNLLFTVTDKKGRFITDLNKDDFEVVDGKRRQTIADFAAESDLPLRLGILIDPSNSIRERFKFEQEAASQFIDSVMRTNLDKALVVSFDTSAELVADLISDTDKLSQDQPRHKFRRAIVIVSDGDDNQSRYTRDQALEMAQKADVVMYAISTNITRIESDGDKVLKYLAQETGGRAFFPFKVEDLDQSFENIANELRHQYNISYRPEPLKTDGLFHVIDVRVRERKNILVNVRRGYYAPKM